MAGSAPGGHDRSLGQRILLVEDDPESREAVAAALRDHSYEVVCARDGAEALGLASRIEADAILLDLVLPVMTGFEFLERRNLEPALARTPVILMTSFTPEGGMLRGHHLPDDVRVLLKPFAATDLVAVVRSALGGEALPLAP